MSKKQEYDWLNDAFDEEKSAQVEEELEHAKRRSRTSAIVLAVVLVVIVLVCFASCAGLALIADSMG